MVSIKSVVKTSIIAISLSTTCQLIANPNPNPNPTIASVEDPQMLDISPKAVHHQASRYISWFIHDYHYAKPKLRDNESAKILEQYIEMLDPNKSYFLASDIRGFQKYRYKMDDSISYGLLNPSFDIYAVFQKRWAERNEYAMSLLNKKMDFTTKDEFQIDREEANWAVNKEELDDYWQKRVKNDALNLVLADKKWEEAKEILTKRYKVAMRRVSQINSEDVFSYFMNAYTNTVDPHTSYFSPRTAENFNIDMKLSLEGIGAVLQADDVYTKINRIVEAGPADKSGEISVDDKIIAVGQDKEPMVDVVGWRLDDVVDLIRGDAGSVVRLEVEPANSTVSGKTKIVSIVREKVKLEEQAAKSEVIEIENGGKTQRVGVIDLPKFYVDFKARYEGKKDYRSTTRDVRRLIEEMKADKGIDALIIDLRSNGGGALDEATALTGLFIDKGPVVQDRNRRGQVEILGDTDAGTSWDGALAVLVNGSSASASEIFAGAIQDYGRGLIIGEQTFGKGTVQTVLDLNQRVRSEDNGFGALKLTVNKFYRITGKSTQMKGVMPDINFPDPYSRKDFGEQSYDSALKWDVINPVDYDKVGDFSDYLAALQKKHEQRIENDREFQYLIEDIAELNKRRAKKTVSLNIEERKQRRKMDKQKQLDRENERRVVKGLKPILQIDENTELTEPDDSKLQEAANILLDYVILQQTNKYADLNNKS
ncbi:carboxy terminal-processing peptidase [Aliikangiella coralliicola]|uniref:Tail-specific protease n=1 Tax=Aliikangiella coralliicola TaxID=2592383 RepID=A0A545UD59_9GAMM|nr:carboxy terminal-processing peptidase [Aliikangiella coralliicola]TQV87400.1 tail-specific protease [Aliikangiella coralliicola]